MRNFISRLIIANLNRRIARQTGVKSGWNRADAAQWGQPTQQGWDRSKSAEWAL